METSNKNNLARLEILIAVLIAIVSITSAVVTWRTTMVSSRAGEASRMGILDTVKKESFVNENWRLVYQEAGYAGIHAIYTAEVEAMETSGDALLMEQARNLRLYLLTNLELLAGEIVTDPDYKNPDGTYNLEERYNSLSTSDPILGYLS